MCCLAIKYQLLYSFSHLSVRGNMRGTQVFSYSVLCARQMCTLWCRRRGIALDKALKKQLVWVRSHCLPQHYLARNLIESCLLRSDWPGHKLYKFTSGNMDRYLAARICFIFCTLWPLTHPPASPLLHVPGPANHHNAVYSDASFQPHLCISATAVNTGQQAAQGAPASTGTHHAHPTVQPMPMTSFLIPGKLRQVLSTINRHDAHNVTAVVGTRGQHGLKQACHHDKQGLLRRYAQT